MKLFENMKNKNLEKDLVTYMNGVRAAGFCRPWEHSMEILKECYSHFGKNILPVANTMITNLKYLEKKSLQSEYAVERAQEVIFWILTQGLHPSSQTMVSTYVQNIKSYLKLRITNFINVKYATQFDFFF